MDLDVTTAESQLNTLIERRAKEHEKANELRDMWAESDRKFRVKRRLALAAEWYAHHCHMSELHARLSAEHEEKALKLLEESD